MYITKKMLEEQVKRLKEDLIFKEFELGQKDHEVNELRTKLLDLKSVIREQQRTIDHLTQAQRASLSTAMLLLTNT